MAEPTKTTHKIMICFLIFAVGVFAGFAGRETMSKMKKKHDRSAYVERHEGQQNFINPLLACDVADDVISNPDILPFKAKIEHFLNTGMDKRQAARVGVYYRELNDGY